MAKKFTTNKGVGRKTKFQLKGGPFHGQIIELHSPGTLEFTVNGKKGHYGFNGEWVDSKQ